MKFTIVNDSSHKLILLSIFSNALEYLHHKRNVTNLFAQKVGDAENPSKSRCILKLFIMKYLKVILPMLAIIFAIGLTFASVNSEPKPDVQTTDFIYLGNDNWQSIPEQECQGTEENCRVQIGAGGPVYDVYDEMDLGTVKLSPADQEPTVINLD
ncbi:hypothetical protein SAMN05660903_01112 [Salegentibacter salinarum]|nr:DUF6520 family protein [Salegentibacter salinarum]SKB50404.1 hypothetical protein SAMN05660903_01112 [Salegentibacter salinarum]